MSAGSVSPEPHKLKLEYFENAPSFLSNFESHSRFKY